LDFRQKDKLKINFLKKNRFWKFSVARSEGKKKPKVQISPDFYIWFSLLKLNIIEVRFKIFLILFLIYSKIFGEIFLLGMIATFFFYVLLRMIAILATNRKSPKKNTAAVASPTNCEPDWPAPVTGYRGTDYLRR
jgi:hypothetical protein